MSTLGAKRRPWPGPRTRRWFAGGKVQIATRRGMGRDHRGPEAGAARQVLLSVREVRRDRARGREAHWAAERHPLLLLLRVRGEEGDLRGSARAAHHRVQREA